MTSLHDPLKDFVPVSQVVSAPLVLAVSSTSPIKSVRDYIREFFGSQGFIVGGGSPEQFRALIEAEVPKWGQVIRSANVKVD